MWFRYVQYVQYHWNKNVGLTRVQLEHSRRRADREHQRQAREQAERRSEEVEVTGTFTEEGPRRSTEFQAPVAPVRAPSRALQCARADQSGCRGPCGVCLEANFGRLRCAWVQLLHWDTLRQPHNA